MKKFIKIIIGMVIFIFGSMILTSILYDEELSIVLGGVLLLLYLFGLSIFNFIKETIEYKKGNNSTLEPLANRLLIGTLLLSNNNSGGNITLINGIKDATAEVKSDTNRIFIINLMLRIIYWLFLISMGDIIYVSSYDIELHAWAEYLLLSDLIACCIIIVLVAIQLINGMNKNKSGYLLIGVILGITLGGISIPFELYVVSVIGFISAGVSLITIIVNRIKAIKDKN